MAALVSQPTKEIVYAARRSNLRLTKQRRRAIRDATGNVVDSTPGEYVGFREGLFSAPAEGTVVLQDTLDGGVAEVEAAELHTWLQKHRLNGDLLEGFWVVEQSAPPVSAGEIDSINELFSQLDTAGLNAMLEQELAGWKRPELIQAIEKSIARLENLQAELEAKAAEPKTEPKPRGK